LSILNRADLIANGSTPKLRRIREDAINIVESALESVDPRRAILNQVKRIDSHLVIGDLKIDLDETERILVVGGGKAGKPMAEAIEELIGDRITDGIVNVPKGTQLEALERIFLNPAGHPIPDTDGVKGVLRITKLVKDLTNRDLVIVLISGGGSAMMPMPAETIDLHDLQVLTDTLLRAGATINELNSVRKHLSGFKGGLFAKKCQPAKVLSLIVSDVIGDPLDTIASGPTAPDSTTFQMAVDVLKRYNVWTNTSPTIRKRLEDGLAGDIDETPKKEDPIFRNVFNFVIANNLIAADSAYSKACELGYNSMILSTFIEGEARQVGVVFAGLAKGVINQSTPMEKPCALILGGETTVTVRGNGKGGRNQELALGAVNKISDLRCVVLTFGTDGVDGSSDAAGAIVDGCTKRRADERGLSTLDYLENNDSHGFFSSLGDSIMTGPTGTNVNDLTLILVR
jgi:glycerate 2-kinase